MEYLNEILLIGGGGVATTIAVLLRKIKTLFNEVSETKSTLDGLANDIKYCKFLLDGIKIELDSVKEMLSKNSEIELEIV